MLFDPDPFEADVPMASASDEQSYTAGQKRPFPGAGTPTGGAASKKKKKPAGPPVQKNALMQLNEIRPGLQYTIIYQSRKLM